MNSHARKLTDEFHALKSDITHTRCLRTVAEVSWDRCAYVGPNNLFPDGDINKLTFGGGQKIRVTATEWCDVSKLRSQQNAVTIHVTGFWPTPLPVERISLLAPSEKWKTEFHYWGADDCGRQASDWIRRLIGWTSERSTSTAAAWRLAVRSTIDATLQLPPRHGSASWTDRLLKEIHADGDLTLFRLHCRSVNSLTPAQRLHGRFQFFFD